MKKISGYCKTHPLESETGKNFLERVEGLGCYYEGTWCCPLKAKSWIPSETVSILGICFRSQKK